MAKSKMKRKRAPKSVLKLPDLEQSKAAVLNSLASPSSQRTYDHAIREFIEWYFSEPRLAFNKTVVTRVPDFSPTARGVNWQPGDGLRSHSRGSRSQLGHVWQTGPSHRTAAAG